MPLQPLPITFEQREFNILKEIHKDPDDRPLVEEFIPEILALVKKFRKSGQSGGSAPYTAGAISNVVRKLCLQEPICPITGIKSEWNDCTSYGSEQANDEDIMYQNNRCSALFKDGKNGKPYYIDAIVFTGQLGCSFTGSATLNDGTKLSSSQYVKEFPWEPKTFYVDVIETEWYKDKETGEEIEQEGGGWWTSVIKDENQLKEIFEYYDKRE